MANWTKLDSDWFKLVVSKGEDGSLSVYIRRLTLPDASITDLTISTRGCFTYKYGTTPYRVLVPNRVFDKIQKSVFEGIEKDFNVKIPSIQLPN